MELRQAAYLSKQNTQIETQTKVKHCKHMQVPDRMSVLTLLMPALSVGNVSACPHTTPIISLSWAPPLQPLSFPWPSGHTTSWDIARTPSPYLKPFDIHTQIRKHTHTKVYRIPQGFETQNCLRVLKYASHTLCLLILQKHQSSYV